MPILLSLLGIGKTIRAFLAKLPWQAYAASAAFMVAMLLWHTIDASAYKRGVAFEKVHTDQAIDALKTTRSSLTTALASIDDMNSAVEKLKSDGDARSSAAAKAMEDLRSAAQGAETKARALEASAAKGAPGGSCAASAAFNSTKDAL